METVAGQKEKAKFAPLVPREKKPGQGEVKKSENKWKEEGGGNKEINIDVGKKTGGSCEGERGVESKGKASGLEKNRGECMKKEGKKKMPDTEKARAADEGVPQQQEGKEGEKGGGEGAKENKKQKNKEEDQSSKETDQGKERMNVKKKKENEKVRKEGKEMKKKRQRDETESNKKVLPLTDSQYEDIFDSATALETPVDNCLEDARAVLSEVELLQATIDQVSLREEEPPRRVSGERKTAASGSQRKRQRKREEQEDSDSSAEFDQWVQCSRSVCGKWRRVERHVDLAALPSDWTCIHDTGPGLCEAAEDSWSEQECDVINSSLVPGSLVWAQQIGYPWWPAIVERDPDTKTFCQFNRNTDLYPCRYHVTYLGEPVSRAWVCRSKVRNYTELTEDAAITGKSLQRFKKKLREAVRIATQAQSIPLKRRLSRFGFWTQQRSDRESSEDSDIAEVMEMLLDHEKSRRSAYVRNKSAVVKAAKRQSDREQSEPIGGDLNEGGKGVKERAGEKKRGEEEGKKRVMTPLFSKLKKGSATTARPAPPPSKDQTVPGREKEEKREGVEEERAEETRKGEERKELRDERSLEEEEKEEEEGHESDTSVAEEAVKEEGRETGKGGEEEQIKKKEGKEFVKSVFGGEEGEDEQIKKKEGKEFVKSVFGGEGGEDEQIKKKEGKEFVKSVFGGEGGEDEQIKKKEGKEFVKSVFGGEGGEDEQIKKKEGKEFVKSVFGGEGGEDEQIKKKEGKEFVKSVFGGEGDEGGEDEQIKKKEGKEFVKSVFGGEGGEDEQIKKKEGKEFVKSVFGGEGGEDDFLDEDMEILGCREEVMKRLAQEPTQEEEDDFSIMLFEEE
ncbi:zinc finger CW-type PWWP domain protein 1-like isoform X2 [Salvelinus fontinalis]|uniref:zinc finger CW-type PWWP domain protein 1-like isoform X2 n=1 Tax=Salvelinus fontinalis TaxID=8038 RepID=UPI0024869F53|nr:zinc finger CW-type PWWP domain protein 1-like isoform X2 [Salvelinus fontinalis]